MTMTREQATLQLEALVLVPGALRIITSEHDCGGGKHPTIGEFDQEACDAYRYGKKDVRHFVIHDVVRIEGPNHRDQYRAFSDEAHGDHCTGQPEALLARLLEVGQVLG